MLRYGAHEFREGDAVFVFKGSKPFARAVIKELIDSGCIVMFQDDSTYRVRLVRLLPIYTSSIVICKETFQFRRMASSQLTEDDSVLEIGSHFGATTKLIHSVTGGKVVGLDKSRHYVEEARRLVPGVEFDVVDILELEQDALNKLMQGVTVVFIDINGNRSLPIVQKCLERFSGFALRLIVVKTEGSFPEDIHGLSVTHITLALIKSEIRYAQVLHLLHIDCWERLRNSPQFFSLDMLSPAGGIFDGLAPLYKSHTQHMEVLMKAMLRPDPVKTVVNAFSVGFDGYFEYISSFDSAMKDYDGLLQYSIDFKLFISLTNELYDCNVKTLLRRPVTRLLEYLTALDAIVGLSDDDLPRDAVTSLQSLVRRLTRPYIHTIKNQLAFELENILELQPGFSNNPSRFGIKCGLLKIVDPSKMHIDSSKTRIVALLSDCFLYGGLSKSIKKKGRIAGRCGVLETQVEFLAPGAVEGASFCFIIKTKILGNLIMACHSRIEMVDWVESFRQASLEMSKLPSSALDSGKYVRASAKIEDVRAIRGSEVEPEENETQETVWTSVLKYNQLVLCNPMNLLASLNEHN